MERRSDSTAIDLTGDEPATTRPQRHHLRATAAQNTDLLGDTETRARGGALKLEQSQALHELLNGRTVRLEADELTRSVDPASVAREAAEWQAWVRGSRDRGQARRGESRDMGTGRVEKRRRFDRGRRPRWNDTMLEGDGPSSEFTDHPRRRPRDCDRRVRTYHDHGYRDRTYGERGGIGTIASEPPQAPWAGCQMNDPAASTETG